MFYLMQVFIRLSILIYGQTDSLDIVQNYQMSNKIAQHFAVKFEYRKMSIYFSNSDPSSGILIYM